MSKHETWRTRQYWQETGGLLIEEFQAVPADRSNNVARRLIDGIIVLNEKTEIYQGPGYDLNGKDIIVVQTKANRLGMYLMGQALFSKELIRRFNPGRIKTVAICGKGDTEMESLHQIYDIEVRVIPDSEKPS